MSTLSKLLNLTLCAGFFLSFLSSPSLAQNAANITTQSETIHNMIYNSGEILETRFYVKFKDNTDTKVIGQLNSKLQAQAIFPEKLNDMFGGNLLLVKTSSKKEMERLMNDYSRDPSVEWVEAMQAGELTQSWSTNFTTRDTSDDYNTTQHWYYEKTKLPELWHDQDCYNSGLECGGSSDVVVAVIDSGVAFENYSANYEYYDLDMLPTFRTSPQLTGINLWTNPGEDYDGGDEDNNLYCDDLHGIDADIELENLSTSDIINRADWLAKCNAGNTDIQKEGHPNDDMGHGTYVSSMIAGLVNDTVSNGTVSGAHNVSIMPIKVTDINGIIWPDVFALAVKYAVDEGADIINASLGFPADSWDSINKRYFLQYAVEYANAHNVLMVVSSGNDNGSIRYPAAYASSYPNLLAIGATNPDNSRSNYSNYGSALTLVAPVGDVAGSGTSSWQETFDNSVLNTCHFMPWSFQCTNTTYKTQANCEAYSGTWYAAPEGICSVNQCDNYTESMCTTAGGTWTAANYLHETYMGEQYWTGTSFAAPQVSAAAAIIAHRGTIRARDLKYLLIDTAQDINTTGKDIYTGYGLLDLDALWNREYFDDVTSWFDSGVGNWDTSRTKGSASGDFNNDGNGDVALMYDYGNNDMGIWVFSSNGSTLSPQSWFRSGAGNWNTANTKGMTAGDFNNDGNSDIALMYDYGNNDMGIWILLSNGSNGFTIQSWFRSGPGNWNTANTQGMAAGDFNNSTGSDIALMYNYGNNDMGMWILLSNGSNGFTIQSWFRSGPGNWNTSQTKGMASGDYNNNGVADISLMYDYGNNDMGIWILLSNGSNGFTIQSWFRSGAGNWNTTSTKSMSSGDYNNSTGSDLELGYDYGSNDLGMWTLKSNGSNAFTIQLWYRAGTNNWDISRTKGMLSADFDNDGEDEVAGIYDYGFNRMGIWVFSKS